MEEGFYYTSESASSGLKSDPDGLGCIWALAFVGPKVAALRNKCCLGLSQIKTRIFGSRAKSRAQTGGRGLGTHRAPHLAPHLPCGRGAGAGQVEGGQRPMGGREKWRGCVGQASPGARRVKKQQGLTTHRTSAPDGQDLVNTHGVNRQVGGSPLARGWVGAGQEGR